MGIKDSSLEKELEKVQKRNKLLTKRIRKLQQEIEYLNRELEYYESTSNESYLHQNNTCPKCNTELININSLAGIIEFCEYCLYRNIIRS